MTLRDGRRRTEIRFGSVCAKGLGRSMYLGGKKIMTFGAREKGT